MKKIFISFDYDHDRNYRNLLSALKSNRRSDIEFEDIAPGEIQSNSVSRVKAVLDTKIAIADYTLVVIGHYANQSHSDRAQIGTLNWQWWEIERASERSHRFIAVKISNDCVTPTPLLGLGATWARAFRVESILNAIDHA